jgi:hypothetical protein
MKAFKFPFILTSMIGATSTLLPYMDLSTPLTEDQSITDLFGIKPMPGYTHEVGMGVGGAMFLTLVLTLIAHRKVIVLWSNAIISSLVITALLYYHLNVTNAFANGPGIAKAILEKLVNIRTGIGVFVALGAAGINVLFAIILGSFIKEETPSLVKPSIVIAPSVDWVGQLDRLSSLKDKGLISTQEYLTEKSSILRSRDEYSGQPLIVQEKQLLHPAFYLLIVLGVIAAILLVVEINHPGTIMMYYLKFRSLFIRIE